MSKYVGLKQGKVHESHVISEYYCGGCGWPVTDHDSYCPECGGELHEGMDKSRWYELFGTPERVARTLMGICEECEEGMCIGCKIDPLMGYATNYDALLEWLGGEA